MDLISNGVLSPRQGSLGQVPTQQQHAAPLHRWTVDAGPKAIEEDLHHPVPCTPHQEVPVKGLSTAGCTRAASIGNGGSLKKVLAPQPTQPRRSSHKMRGGNILPDAEGQVVNKATPCSIPKENWRAATDDS